MKRINRGALLSVGLIVFILFLAFFAITNVAFLASTGNILSQEDPNFRLSTSAYNKVVKQGGDLIINSNVVKLGSAERIDVILEIDVKDQNNKSIDKSLETFAIETQVNIVREVHIFNDASPGKYTIRAKLFHGEEEVAASTTQFSVTEGSGRDFTLVFIMGSIIITLILLVISLIIFINHVKAKRRKRS